ncbi:MAG: hypothetical protein IKV40_02435, partial [Clostridia bacterium]|nr:hypothetical protein [Clostridia bacterium]
SLTRAQLAVLIYRINDIFTANLPGSEIWSIPEGDTVFTELPENAATVTFHVNRINNRYLIENEKGEYICTTTDVTIFDYDTYGNWAPYVYGTMPCYSGEYILEIPFPWYFFEIPDSEIFTIIPQYSDNVDFGFKGLGIDGYGIEKITIEGKTVTIYGTRATIRTTNADEAGYTVVFADK